MVNDVIGLDEKIDLLERYHQPIYLGKEQAMAYLTMPDPYYPANYDASLEIDRVYRLAYKEARDLRGRANLLRSYVSNFPDLAWARLSWFWTLWNKLREEREENSESLLESIASGVRTTTSKLHKFHRQRKIENAKRRFRQLMDPENPEEQWYIFQSLRESSENRKLLIEEVKTFLKDLLENVGCRVPLDRVVRKLETESPAHVLRMIVADLHQVREADLASRSPLDTYIGFMEDQSYPQD